MDPILVIIIFITIFVLFFVSSGFKIIQQAETMVIERLGKYNRTLDSGINIVIPILDKPRAIFWRYRITNVSGEDVTTTTLQKQIDLREQVFDFPRQNVITKDNVTIEIDAMLYFQITDPVKSTYEIANLPNAIEKLTQTTLRNVMGELALDECLVSRDVINTKLRGILDEATDKWGVKVNRVELQDITPPEDIQKAMEQQMRAERDRRAKILEAEGNKKSAILEAEGVKESEINIIYVHARTAILNGLSPKNNRNIPPLKYDFVYKIKKEFPNLKIIINGEINDIASIKSHLNKVDGVMIGREIYKNPFFLKEIENEIFENKTQTTRKKILEKLVPYIENEIKTKNASIQCITRHTFGLFTGIKGSKKWKQYLNNIKSMKGDTKNIILNGVKNIDE